MTGSFFRVKPELFDEIMGEEIDLVEDLFVFVLEDVGEGAVKVAQLGPRQILDDPVSEFGFIQTWNTYTMSVQDLDGPYRTVNTEILERIKHQCEELERYVLNIDDSIGSKYDQQINLGSIVAQASIAKLI